MSLFIDLFKKIYYLQIYNLKKFLLLENYK